MKLDTFFKSVFPRIRLVPCRLFRFIPGCIISPRLLPALASSTRPQPPWERDLALKYHCARSVIPEEGCSRNINRRCSRRKVEPWPAGGTLSRFCLFWCWSAAVSFGSAAPVFARSQAPRRTPAEASPSPPIIPTRPRARSSSSSSTTPPARTGWRTATAAWASPCATTTTSSATPTTAGDRTASATSTDIGHWWTWFRGPTSATYTGRPVRRERPELLLLPPGHRPRRRERDRHVQVLLPQLRPSAGARPIPSRHRQQPAGGQTPARSPWPTPRASTSTSWSTSPPARTSSSSSSPPRRCEDATYAANARAFNNWLVNDWLAGYPYSNVAVFDFYNVLTTNGGSADTNDLGWATGNHHRWWNGAIQHKTDGGGNTLAYPSGDDHPN